MRGESCCSELQGSPLIHSVVLFLADLLGQSVGLSGHPLAV